MLAISGGLLVGCKEAYSPGRRSCVTVDDGIVTSLSGDQTATQWFDADGLFVCPGFIDLQCNGAHGIDLTSEPGRLWELAACLPRYGITSFLPTLVSASSEEVSAAVAVLRRRPDGFKGAEPVGLHLEGPMISPRYRGAHEASRLHSPDLDLVVRSGREGAVALVTLAPELPGALDVVGCLRDTGVVVSAGHTDATTGEMLAAIDHGLSGVTHLFNAMRPFGHRDSGPVGVALTDDRLIAGLIVDGVHVEPRAVQIAWRLLGPSRLALVTDSVAALGSPLSEARLSGHRIHADGEAVRDESGRLAGSCLAMDQAVRNLVRFTGCSLADAVRCATETPARLIRSYAGVLAPGAPADIVIMTPEAEIVTVIVRGSVVHGAAAWNQ